MAPSFQLLNRIYWNSDESFYGVVVAGNVGCKKIRPSSYGGIDAFNLNTQTSVFVMYTFSTNFCHQWRWL